MFPFQLFSSLVFSPGLSESALHCKKRGCLSRLRCGQACLGRKESVLFPCRPALSKQREKESRAEEASPTKMLLNAPESQEAVDEGQTVTHSPTTLQSGRWRMKRASEKQYPNPVDCNSFQNARNFTTWGPLYKTASQTPPYFAIRYPRLTHFPMNYFSFQSPS